VGACMGLGVGVGTGVGVGLGVGVGVGVVCEIFEFVFKGTAGEGFESKTGGLMISEVCGCCLGAEF
jgi:hypothetical protein